MKRLALAWLLAGLACARAEEDPGRVVNRYLRSLGRDPLRAIVCVTPAFQERHGLRLETSAEAQRWRERVREGATAPVAPDAPSTPSTPEEARISWLSVQVKPAFREELTRLSWRLSTEHRDDERHATVAVTIEPIDAPAFQQTFHLVREQGSRPWRIDRVEQSGVGPSNLAAAYVTNPTEEVRRRLAARLGVPPD